MVKEVCDYAKNRIMERVVISDTHILATLMDPKLKNSVALKTIMIERNLDEVEVLEMATYVIQN